MPIRIHHTQTKKAQKLGFNLAIVENEVEVYKDGRLLASSPFVNVAIDKAVERLKSAEGATEANADAVSEATEAAEATEATEVPADQETDTMAKTAPPRKGKTRTAAPSARKQSTTGPRQSRSIVDTEKYAYDPIVIRDHTGKVRRSYGNQDAIAKAMLGVISDDLGKLAKANGLDKYDPAKYRNPGHARMNVGNMLRAKVRRGESITINGVEITKLNQKVDVPEVLPKPRKSAGATKARRSA